MNIGAAIVQTVYQSSQRTGKLPVWVAVNFDLPSLPLGTQAISGVAIKIPGRSK